MDRHAVQTSRGTNGLSCDCNYTIIYHMKFNFFFGHYDEKARAVYLPVRLPEARRPVYLLSETEPAACMLRASRRSPFAGSRKGQTISLHWQ
jgi:hypothetical protein